jgi:hypothetical protein
MSMDGTIRLPASAPLVRSDTNVAGSVNSPVSQKTKRQQQIYDNGLYPFRHLILVILRTQKRGRDGYDTTTYFVLRSYPKLRWEEEKEFVQDLLQKHHPGLYKRLEARRWEWVIPELK